MRHRNLLPTAAKPRSAVGRYLGSARPDGRSCGPAAELCWANGAAADQHLRRDQACPRAHLGRLDGRSRHTSERAASAECLRTGPVADKFVHRNSCSFRTIGTRAAHVGGLRRRTDRARFRLYRRCRRGALRCDRGSCGRTTLPRHRVGIPTTIHELARKIAAICDAPEPMVVAKFRDGDVRAARCDIEPAKNELDWRPKWPLEDGLRALLDWIGGHPELSVEPSDHAYMTALLK